MPQVTGPITTTAPTDTYPTHSSTTGIGGLHEVDNHAARNAISVDRRRPGMIAYTANDDSYWKLRPAPWSGTDSDWTPFVVGGGGEGPTPTEPLLAEFIEPVLVWEILHDLGQYPSVTLISDGQVFHGDVTYPQIGLIVVNFDVPMAGVAVVRP